MYPVKHISVSIRRSPDEVYDFASNPQNLPKWAAGLSETSIEKAGDAWVCDSPMGRVKVKFAERNSFGILDHEVILPSGEVNYNPFRVFANGLHSEVVFTLFRRPQMSEQDFEGDSSQVAQDLASLKRILESERASST